MIKIKCEKCGNEWDTKSTRLFVSCPNCLRKVKNNVGDNAEKKAGDKHEKYI